jgi:hypothetical protein
MDSDFGIALGVFLFIEGFACAISCVAIAEKKGYTGGLEFIFFFVGVLFNLVGVMVMLLIPERAKGVDEARLASGELQICPFCKESILAGAIVCKHCQSKLD